MLNFLRWTKQPPPRQFADSLNSPHPAVFVPNTRISQMLFDSIASGLPLGLLVALGAAAFGVDVASSFHVAVRKRVGHLGLSDLCWALPLSGGCAGAAGCSAVGFVFPCRQECHH